MFLNGPLMNLIKGREYGIVPDVVYEADSHLHLYVHGSWKLKNRLF